MARAKKVRIQQPVAEDLARKLWKEVCRFFERDSPSKHGNAVVGLDLFMFEGSAHLYANIVKRDPKSDVIYLKIVELGELEDDDSIPF